MSYVTDRNATQG